MVVYGKLVNTSLQQEASEPASQPTGHSKAWAIYTLATSQQASMLVVRKPHVQMAISSDKHTTRPIKGLQASEAAGQVFLLGSGSGRKKLLSSQQIR